MARSAGSRVTKACGLLLVFLSLGAAAAAAAATGSGPDRLQGPPAALRGGSDRKVASGPDANTSSITGAGDDESLAERWQSVSSLLDGWEFTQRYAVVVGGPAGRVYSASGGGFSMQDVIPIGSTSKWPSAMMFAGLADDGTVHGLDDPLGGYLPWWTTDPQDPRSTVTFRMLLSFTSGFGGGHPGEESNSRGARRWRAQNNRTRKPPAVPLAEVAAESVAPDATECDQKKGDVTSCARWIYDNVKLIGTPGYVYSYNSNHLWIAAAVAVAASGKEIGQIIEEYLLKPFGMKRSFYVGKCPDFGGGLMTTGDDYEGFLRGLLSYSARSKAIVDASEADATPFMSDYYTLYGNYGFGHFLWCFDSVDGMTDACRDERTHSSPGAFGFIPMIDRKRDYYFMVVAAEFEAAGGTYALSGIPEYLAIAIKPHVDAAYGDGPINPAAQATHNPGFLSLSVADVNYCLGCKLHPKTCE